MFKTWCNHEVCRRCLFLFDVWPRWKQTGEENCLELNYFSVQSRSATERELKFGSLKSDSYPVAIYVFWGWVKIGYESGWGARGVTGRAALTITPRAPQPLSYPILSHPQNTWMATGYESGLKCLLVPRGVVLGWGTRRRMTFWRQTTRSVVGSLNNS